MRHYEDPPPGTPSHRSYLCFAWLCLFDVCGGRVLGNPTTIGWGNVWAAVGLADQGRGRFFLLIVVVDDSNESAVLGRSAS